MPHDSFDRLAAALAPDRPPPAAPAPRKKRKKKKAHVEPDRSRDHAIYAAPHRPPARSSPLHESDVATVRRRRAEPLITPDPPRRGPPIGAVVAAVLAAVIAFGIVALAGLSPG